MSKKFTETEKWNDKWFRSLSPNEKLVFLFLCERCDLAGFYEIDPPDMSHKIGLPEMEILGAVQGLNRGIDRVGDWVWIINHLKHQRNLPLNEKNNAHKHIIGRINEMITMFPNVPSKLGADMGLFSPIGKGKGKGKSKSKGKGGELPEGFSDFWAAYPPNRRVGKAEAVTEWKNIENAKDLLGKITTALKWQSTSQEWIKEDGIYIPHPCRYLKKRRWEDEQPKVKEWVSTEELCRQALELEAKNGRATV